MTEQLWEVIEEPIPIHKCVKPPRDKFPVGTVIRCTVCHNEFFLARSLAAAGPLVRWIRRMPND